MPTLLHGPASTYLLSLDQLHVAGFTTAEKAHRVDAATVSAGDRKLLAGLGSGVLQDAATVRYFRSVPDLATANGFVDVRSTVLRFDGVAAAHRAFLAEVAHTDAVAGILPESTGALGDESHAGQLSATTPLGVSVLEVTVIMRNANLVELIVLRGRTGGTSLSDGIVLGHAQLSSQPG